MRNPYKELFKPVLENPDGEPVTGAFTCQEDDCWSTVKDAKYIEEIKVLTWKCSKGHISKLEDYIL